MPKSLNLSMMSRMYQEKNMDTAKPSRQSKKSKENMGNSFRLWSLAKAGPILASKL